MITRQPALADFARGVRRSGVPLLCLVSRARSASLSAPRATAEERTAILESSITLIQRAALQPGGENFEMAVKKLNQYFEGTTPSSYQLEPAAREYLATQLPPAMLKTREPKLESPRRHAAPRRLHDVLRDREPGGGDGRGPRPGSPGLRLGRAAGSAGAARFAGVGPAAAGRSPGPTTCCSGAWPPRPRAFWAERAWLFMALCRQLGIDTGLITYTKSDTLEPRRECREHRDRADVGRVQNGAKPPIVWICTALIDDKAYLFDARLGLEIPGPDGTGVATLDQALADPAILERMNLPGLSPYGTSRASLLGSPTKIGILIDSSPGYFSPKMKLLQGELSGKHRTILYSDPAEPARPFRPRPGRPRGASISVGHTPGGRDSAFQRRAVRRLDPGVSVPVPISSSPWSTRGSSISGASSMKRSRTTSGSGSPKRRPWSTTRNADSQGSPGRAGRLRHLLSGPGPPRSGTTSTRPS